MIFKNQFDNSLEETIKYFVQTMVYFIVFILHFRLKGSGAYL